MIRKTLTSWTRTIQSRLHNKLLLSYALIIIIPLLILGSILYSSTISLTKEHVQEIRSLEMNILSQNLQEYINSLELYSRVIYSEPVQELLNAGMPADLVEQTRWKASLFQRFDEWFGYMGIKASIQNVTIVLPDGRMVAKESIYKGEWFADEPWYKHAQLLQGEIYVAGPMERSFTYPSSLKTPYTFSLVRKINNSIGSSELGGIVIDINVMDIAGLLNRLQINDMTILNADDQIVYSNRSDDIGTQWSYGTMIQRNASDWIDIDGKRMFASSIYSDAAGWRFVTLDPLHRIQTQSNTYRNLTISLGLFALFIALVISTYISRRITKPLRTLQHNMKQVRTGNFNVHMKAQSSDEVGQLTLGFNRMTEEIHRLVTHVYKSEIARKEAQLKALHSQINPHFLYNTLDSMNAIAMIEEVPQLSRMTKMLSDMFRYSISAGDHPVPLREELRQIERYVEIQNIRYDHKFSLHLAIPEHLLDYPIPKLILQPIVENAIYYGLEMIPEAGRIDVACFELDSYTILEIKDNGLGVQKDQLEEIQNKLLLHSNDEAHIGLANVQERIQLHYGEEYGIALHSEYGAGTTVTYKFPLLKK